MTPSFFRLSGAVLALTVVASVTAPLASAQSAPSTQSAPSSVTASAQPATSNMQVRQIQSGFVFAPEVRVTKINDRTATLVGAYGGWQTDRTFFVGLAGYALANRDRNFEMQYGGALVKWSIGGQQTAGLTPGLFLGVGTATVARTLSDWGWQGMPRRPDPRYEFGPLTMPTMPEAFPLRVHDEYGIAEPQVNAFWNINRWLRLDAGIGYRFIGGSELLAPHLRGISGSVALQVGGR
jgi:hypothetical protein